MDKYKPKYDSDPTDWQAEQIMTLAFEGRKVAAVQKYREYDSKAGVGYAKDWIDRMLENHPLEYFQLEKYVDPYEIPFPTDYTSIKDALRQLDFYHLYDIMSIVKAYILDDGIPDLKEWAEKSKKEEKKYYRFIMDISEFAKSKDFHPKSAMYQIFSAIKDEVWYRFENKMFPAGCAVA